MSEPLDSNDTPRDGDHDLDGGSAIDMGALASLLSGGSKSTADAHDAVAPHDEQADDQPSTDEVDGLLASLETLASMLSAAIGEASSEDASDDAQEKPEDAGSDAAPQSDGAATQGRAPAVTQDDDSASEQPGGRDIMPGADLSIDMGALASLLSGGGSSSTGGDSSSSDGAPTGGVAPASPSSPQSPSPINPPSGEDNKHEGSSPSLENVTDVAETFRAQWLPLCSDAEFAFNLIFSPQENDLNAAIIADDDTNLEAFIASIGKVLHALGKTDSPKPISAPLGSRVLSFNSYGSNSDQLFPSRKLCIITHLGDIKSLKQNQREDQLKALAEEMGKIVDNRYVIVVGTNSEVNDFIHLDTGVNLSFGRNVIRLAGMDSSAIFDSYLSFLDEDIRKEVDDSFRREFLEIIEGGSRSIPYHGRELSDYLAKLANSKGALWLPEDAFEVSTIDEMLESIVGLPQVKRTVKNLEAFAALRDQMSREGKPLPPANMHMLFEGPPGTGKTMVARLISRLLYKIGITQSETFREVSSKDLIAKYVGHTAPQLHDEAMQALGGVLFIDEAYSLIAGQGDDGKGGFGSEAIAELIRIMEDYKDQLVIILAGYEREMQEFVDSNPGIRSRIGYTFKFDNYSVDELMEIFGKTIEQYHLFVGDDVQKRVRATLEYFSRFKSFGNGRFVNELVQKAVINHAIRLAAEEEPTEDDATTLTIDDIPDRHVMYDILDWKKQDAAKLLDPLVGLEDIKNQVMSLEKTVAYREDALRSNVMLPDLNLNMVFYGNPGTGKTTVARIVGEVLYNVGVIPRKQFVEVQAKDLMSTTVGEVGKKVTEVVERSMGGVLFLDEAYALLESSQGNEILATLVKHMSDHVGELIVIFAGYRREMRAFIDRNPGLASRIGYTFDFKDYEADELNEIFRRKMEKTGLKLADGVLDESYKIFKFFHSVRDFGNGRFVDKVIQETIVKRAARYDGVELDEILPTDLPTIKELCTTSATIAYDPSDLENDDALTRVAKHEMGHAVARLAATGGTDIMVITIEREGNGALGYVQHKASSVPLPTSKDLRAEIACLMGGMAGEQLFFGSYSAGNSSDLRTATQMAMRYVGMYGMSSLGFVQFVDPEGEQPSVDRLSEATIAAMNALLSECFEEAKRLITEHQEAYDALVDAVLAESTMTGERVLEVWKQHEASAQ